jgi:hypothetical protein
MNDESYEADRRGDPQALELLLNLANKIHQAPEAHARIRNDARELAQRLRANAAEICGARSRGASPAGTEYRDHAAIVNGA